MTLRKEVGECSVRGQQSLLVAAEQVEVRSLFGIGRLCQHKGVVVMACLASGEAEYGAVEAPLDRPFYREGTTWNVNCRADSCGKRKQFRMAKGYLDGSMATH